MAIPDTMGERIRVAAKGAGLSQTTLAELMGVDRNTVGMWIKGDDVPERRLERIAEITGRSKVWLRYGVSDGSEKEIARYITGLDDARREMTKLRDWIDAVLDRMPSSPKA